MTACNVIEDSIGERAVFTSSRVLALVTLLLSPALKAV